MTPTAALEVIPNLQPHKGTSPIKTQLLPVKFQIKYTQWGRLEIILPIQIAIPKPTNEQVHVFIVSEAK